MKRMRAFFLFLVLMLGFIVAVSSGWAAENVETNSAPARAAAPSLAPTARLTFWLDQVPTLQPRYFGFPLWEYLAVAIYVAIAFLIARLLNYIVGVWLKGWAAKTPNRIDDWVIRLVHGPLKLIVLVIFLHFGLQVFHWPLWLAHWLSKGLHVIVAISLTYMGLRLVDLLINHWRVRAATREDTTFNEQLFPIVSRSTKVAVVILAVLVTADNIGINIRSAIAGLSIGGLALGLAAQDTVANLFGAVAIFMDKPLSSTLGS